MAGSKRRQSSRREERIMEIKAWIQMGCERREVTFDVSEAEIEMSQKPYMVTVPTEAEPRRLSA